MFGSESVRLWSFSWVKTTRRALFLHLVRGQVVCLPLDVIQWIQHVFALRGSSREEAVQEVPGVCGR